ncbi:MAG: hypothetical protein CMB61_05360 [Euryarchaeota archaeon]|nr:hypothetical protein [Euryarchaeota archaeon]
MDRGRNASRLIVAILILSSLSMSTVANDAGSGSDAGSSTSTATPLPTSNATYYGNLSSTDTEDFFSISVPNGSAMTVGLTSPSSADFDPYVYDSSGTLIDYSYTTQSYEEASTNGTSVGGTTVYIEIRLYSGSGQYTMQVWIFPDQSPQQNDANSGGDAGLSASSSLALNSSNQTLNGWISDSFDTYDWYNITVPTGNGVFVTMSFPNATGSSQLSLIESTATYYINYDYTAPFEVTSNGTNVGGGHVYIRVYSGSDEGNYSLNISFFSTSGQPGSNQDDARSGSDAGNTLSNALQINMTGNTTTIPGWVDETWDDYDFYSIAVPSNWTTWASISWNNSSADLDLVLYDSNQSTLDSSWSSNPESVSGNSSAIGGTTVYYRVSAWSGTDVSYNLTIGMGNLSDSPAYNQNDANSGGDVGNDIASSFALPIDNGSYGGWISDSMDSNDFFSVQVPSGYAIQANLSWNNSANDFDLYLYDQSQSQIDSSFNDNPESVQSGATNVSGTTVYIQVESYQSWWGSGGGEGNYTLDILFLNQSSVPGLNQNDAYSGGDAGNNSSSATPLYNATTGYSMWPGYVDSGSDTYDYYQVYIPADHGISAELSPGYGNSQWLALELYDSANNLVDSDYYSLTQNVSTIGTGTYLGGSNAIISVYALDGAEEYNLSMWIFNLDADGDGFYDEVEYSCGSDPFDNNSTPSDTDADGICDTLDEDIDGDGVDNSNDTFPEDANETTDSDGDGTGDNADEDDDNDGWTDTEEYFCGTDHNDSTSVPDDLDSDGVCDVQDDDIDGDGYENFEDFDDYDPTEWNDTDSDGIGDNSDGDDDGDGYYDGVEEDCLSDPLDGSSIPEDTDSDGVCDELDDDIDGDGIGNDLDAFPDSSEESVDTDGDGFGDNADPDDDNDGYPDIYDLFPLDPTEWTDNDADLTGDNADPDDDNDGWFDTDEEDCGTNPFLMQSSPDDADSDGICDVIDPDDDNDAWNDTIDSFPFDPNEWDDLDQDNLGSNSDPDDDGDGWDDSVELSICGTDPRDATSIPDDFDGDRICDNLDDDDDNDLVLDFDDAFPFDPTETKDTDGDKKGDGADTDDDNDDWPDTTELICDTSPLSNTSVPDDFDDDGTCDLIDPDDDNDGWSDLEDSFPYDQDEWADRNSDGKGDNEFPLTAMDHMRLNPVASIIGLGLISALLAGSVAFFVSRRGMVEEEMSEEELWDSYDEDEADSYEEW